MQQVRNSIGYVDYAQATQTGTRATRSSRTERASSSGRTPRAFKPRRRAPIGAQTSDFYLLLTDGPGEEGLSHHRDGVRAHAQERPRAARTRAALDFFQMVAGRRRRNRGAARIRAAARSARPAGQGLLGQDLQDRHVGPCSRRGFRTAGPTAYSLRSPQRSRRDRIVPPPLTLPARGERGQIQRRSRRSAASRPRTLAPHPWHTHPGTVHPGTVHAGHLGTGCPATYKGNRF